MKPNRQEKEQSEYRLPTNVKPTHYDLTFKTDLKKATFEGVVIIAYGDSDSRSLASLEVKKDTSTITLNVSRLELRNATILSEEGEKPVVVVQTDEAQERVTYKLDEKLPSGSQTKLKIYFSGKLGGNMMGYLRGSWEYEGSTEFYALTQFQPTAARSAFPCWDEPLLKATFTITMISRADTVSLSNMPALSEQPILEGLDAETWKITKFDTTPPMSTYIVALANGPFKFWEKSVVMPLSRKTIPLRIYTSPAKVSQAEFVLGVTASVLPLYERILGVEYPLPKLDTVAGNIVDGAMENWGLIIGRSAAFLLDTDNADLLAKKRVASTQSHEIAHLWFGDITTMEWWNYLYLNEGMLTPPRIIDRFLVFTRNGALIRQRLPPPEGQTGVTSA
ncbi:Aminopeptidase 2 [Psilocybe cubensis]|uniref:Aminopeptidase 2 n=1 Tax=Psilocybe cubensis TaxID=181762 RepID=A0ACB8GR79_PSICU|nr:Aminopeptidase 2 [Psilocybe cubensis]KAH9477731.1 Aminopeptidase 2 [Psilocybe cubensis]